MARIFESTFDYPEWTQADGLSDAVCSGAVDGVTGVGSWTTSNGGEDQITSAANMAVGGGGRGFRHKVGDGLNNGGGAIIVPLGDVPEFWMRFYARFPAGFAWNGTTINMKMIYVNSGSGTGGTFYHGFHVQDVGGHAESDPVDYGEGLGNHHANMTWNDVMGGSVGDGLWHCWEVHAKMNTLSGNSDGEIHFWIDGVLVYTRTGVHLSNANGSVFVNVKVGENHNSPLSPGGPSVDQFVDFDDIVVDDAGYIGPLAAGGGNASLLEESGMSFTLQPQTNPSVIQGW